MSTKRVPTFSWRYWVLLAASAAYVIAYSALEGGWRLLLGFAWGLVLATCWTGERTAIDRSELRPEPIRNSSTGDES